MNENTETENRFIFESRSLVKRNHEQSKGKINFDHS